MIKLNLNYTIHILDSQRKPINSSSRTMRNGDIPYFGATGQVGRIDDFLFDEELVLLGEDAAPFFDKSKSVAYLISGKSWVNNHAHVIKARDGVTGNKYLLYYLNHFNYKGYVNGTTRLKLNQESMKSMQIPLVSLPHQALIVAEIEKQMSRLDSGLSSLQKLQTLIKQYRASILHTAYTGSIIQSNSSNLQTFSNIILGISQGWSPKCEPCSASLDQWGVIKTTAIQTGFFDESENKLLPSTLSPRKALEIKEGDLLMTRAGPRIRVGICCLVRKVRIGLICCDKVYRINYDQSKVLGEYLEIIMGCGELVNQLDQIKTGISDSGLNLTQSRLLDLKIPLPPLAEQQRIVTEVEGRLSVIDQLEVMVNANITRAHHLKQSILHKAFSGKLVDYIDKQEDIDELLANIEKVKLEMSMKSKSRGKKS